MNEIVTTRTDVADLEFDIQTVNRYLQIRHNSSEYDNLQETITELYQKYKSVLKPADQYRILAVRSTTSEDSSAMLENGTVVQGIGIHRLLAKSKYAAVFVATVGNAIDGEISKLQKQDLLAGYCLEGIASALVTSLLENMKTRIAQAAAKLSCKVSYRYAPGYAHWDLSEQSKLFSILQPEEIGVYLTESYYVTPRNSLTGMFGLAEEN